MNDEDAGRTNVVVGETLAHGPAECRAVEHASSSDGQKRVFR